MIRVLVLAAATAIPMSAVAQELPTRPYLPMATALKAASAAIDSCKASGFNVSVAIVGRDGNTRVHLMADNSGAHTVGSASGKAFTSASIGLDTATFSKIIGEKPELAGLHNLDDRMVVSGGGLPINMGGVLVGGIGVGGAPGGHLDTACAKAGLEAIGADS